MGYVPEAPEGSNDNPPMRNRIAVLKALWEFACLPPPHTYCGLTRRSNESRENAQISSSVRVPESRAQWTVDLAPSQPAPAAQGEAECLNGRAQLFRDSVGRNDGGGAILLFQAGRLVLLDVGSSGRPSVVGSEAIQNHTKRGLIRRHGRNDIQGHRSSTREDGLRPGPFSPGLLQANQPPVWPDGLSCRPANQPYIPTKRWPTFGAASN